MGGGVELVLGSVGIISVAAVGISALPWRARELVETRRALREVGRRVELAAQQLPSAQPVPVAVAAQR
jgi:hypothetical protein